MKTLYDLLGARPNDDAERLRSAFRQAVKANHPDHHSDDHDASIRFRRIVEAYDILRDANQRAAYDRLLQFERRQRRLKLRRTIFSYLYDAVAAAGLASALLAGYALITHISKISVEELVWSKARGSTVAAIHQQNKPASFSAPEMPIMVPDIMASPGNDTDAPGVTRGGAGSSATAQNTDTPKIDNTAGIDEDLAKIAVYRPDEDPETELFDNDKTRLSDTRLSSPEKADGAPGSSLSDVPMAGDKRDFAVQDKRDIGAHDVKTPEYKLLGKPRMEAKREAKSHAPFKQASLENRSTPACADPASCSTDTPPLFGVGF
jgi:curved DNA-binding protein CbpA